MTPPSSVTPCHSSLLGRWDPRLRLVALMLLAFTFSSVRDLVTIVLMLMISCCCWALSRLPIGDLIQRLKYPSLLLFVIALTLLFGGSGTQLIDIGMVTITTEGALAALQVSARFYAIVVLAITFFAVAPLMTHIRALRSLGLPEIMVDMALLMVRYLEVLKQEVGAMGVALRLRGFRRRGWSFTTIRLSSWLVGNLLLHSYERAEGIYKAMRLRGYGVAERYSATPPLTLGDGSVFFLVVVGSAGLLWLG